MFFFPLISLHEVYFGETSKLNLDRKITQFKKGLWKNTVSQSSIMFLLCGRLLKSLTWELIFPQGRVCLPVTLASSAWRITQKNEALEFLAFNKFILIDVYSRNEHCWKGQWCNAKLKGNFHETHTYEIGSVGRDGSCCFSFSFWRLLFLTGLGWARSLFCVLATWEDFTSEFSCSLWAVLQAYVLLRTMSWSLSRSSVLKWQGSRGSAVLVDRMS